MTISLVSAPVLGFDLVRHPRGRSVADTLLWALSLGPEHLSAFDTAPATPADVRGEAWSRVREVRDGLGRGALNGSVLSPSAEFADGAVSAGSVAGIIEVLRTSLVVDLDDMEHLVRRDILDWSTAQSAEGTAASAETAADLLVDAVAADWVDGLNAVTRSDLTHSYRIMRDRLGARSPDIGPCAPQIHEVLRALRELGADGRLRLRTVNSLLGSGGAAWSQAVHAASWAALTTGRIRAAATAQLMAAQAFIDGGLNATDGAEGVWNMISGHVHALVVADVLPTDTAQALGRGWRGAIPAR